MSDVSKSWNRFVLADFDDISSAQFAVQAAFLFI